MLTENAEEEDMQINTDLNNENEDFPEEDPVLLIKTALIQQEEKRKYGNRLIEEINYDKAGTNGVFESNPKIVKIKGFELNKKTSVKISLVNKSKFSQRVSIVPPTTPFFKIKYSRKGMISPGLAEVVVITFSPQNYIYYNDYIRVICEGDNMIVPIHAFPKMNIHMKNYIPRSIDFGTVAIHTGEHREIILRNIIDVPFEYEIVPLKTCEEIRVEPVEGLIDAISNRIIKLNFLPHSYGFFRSEYEFRLSEMEYQPVVITVCGSCNVFEKVLTENIIKHMKRLKEPQSSSPSLGKSFKQSQTQRIAINNDLEKEMNISSNILGNEPLYIEASQDIVRDANENINENANVNNVSPLNLNANAIDKLSTSLVLPKSESTKGISKKYKNFPSNKEREFLNYFNNVDNVIKDKEIKYKRFIGKQLLTDDEINKIVTDRIKDLENNHLIKRKIDTNRHSFETDLEKCCVDRKNKYLLKPTFDFNQNDKFFKTRHYYNIFLKSMTKVLINTRAEKRLNKLKDMILKKNIKSPNDFYEFVENDWANQFNRDSEDGGNETKLKFVVPSAWGRGEVYVSNDLNIDAFKQEISHENNINLEELREYENLERSEVEVIGYKEFKSTGLTMFEIATNEKIFRTCGENEQSVRSERGDSEMAFDKIMNLIEMPESYKAHIDTKIDTLLFNNPSFKKYVTYSSFPETSIDYNLQPRPMDSNDDFTSNYSNELYSRLPLTFYDNTPLRELDNMSLIGDTSLDFLPLKLKQADQRDLFIKPKEKVDEDNLIFQLPKEDEDKLINDFEKDDEVIKNVRELNKEEVFDLRTRDKINLENYLQAQKRKWMSTLPTVLEFYNSSVVNPNNKFIL